MPASAEIVVARIRFNPRDARRLRTAALLTPPGDDLGLFNKAAESAEADELLVIHCTTEELRHMTDRLQHYGFTDFSTTAHDRKD